MALKQAASSRLLALATDMLLRPAAASSSHFSTSVSTVTDLSTTTKRNGQLRSTTGVGIGDGFETHTDKWMQPKEGATLSPQEWIDQAEPIAVSKMKVASYGTEDTNLGCPVEYIDLRDTSYEKPAVCKYTGNKYYWDGTPDHH